MTSINFSPILNNLDAFSLTAHLLTNGRQFIHKMLQAEKEVLTPTSHKKLTLTTQTTHLTEEGEEEEEKEKEEGMKEEEERRPG